jgi:hypothetical protein
LAIPAGVVPILHSDFGQCGAMIAVNRFAGNAA